MTVTCNDGYEGGGDWTCQANGDWSFSAGADTCSASACTATKVDHSDHSEAGSIRGNTGDTVTVTCADGYDGGGDWVCGTDGTFAPAAGVHACYTCGPDRTALNSCKFKLMTTGQEEQICNRDSDCFYAQNASCQPHYTKKIFCDHFDSSDVCGANSDSCQWDPDYQKCKPNEDTIQACASKDSSACSTASELQQCQWMGTCHTKPTSDLIRGWTGTKGENCAEKMDTILADSAANANEPNRIIYCNKKGRPKPGDDVECICEEDFSGKNCETAPPQASSCGTHLTQGNPDSCYEADGTPKLYMESCCWAPDGAQVNVNGALRDFSWFKQDLNRVAGQNNCGCDCSKAVTGIETHGNTKHETVVDFTDEGTQYHYKDENNSFTNANGDSVSYGTSCVENCTDSSPTDCTDADGNKLTGDALASCANVNTPCHGRGQCNSRTNKCKDTTGYPSYCDMDTIHGSPYIGDYCENDGDPDAGDLNHYNAFCGMQDNQGKNSGYAIKNTTGDGKLFKCECNGDWGHSGKDAWELGWAGEETGDERGIYACDVSPCEGNTWKTVQTRLDNLMPLEVNTYEYLNDERPVYITKGMTVHWPDAYKAPDYANRLKMNPNVVTSDGEFDFAQNHIVVAAVAPKNSKGVPASWAGSNTFVQDHSDRTPGMVKQKTIFEMEGEHDANTSDNDLVYLGIEKNGVITKIEYHQLPQSAKIRFSWPYTGAQDNLTCGHFDYSAGSEITKMCETDNDGNNRVCPCKSGLVKDGQDMCATNKCNFGWFGPKCQYPMDGSQGPNLCDWDSLNAIANPQAVASNRYKWVDVLDGFPMDDRYGRPSRLGGTCKDGATVLPYKTVSECIAAARPPAGVDGGVAPHPNAVWVSNPGSYKIKKADLLPNESSNQTCMVVRRDGRTIGGSDQSPLDISYVGKGDTLANKWQKGGVDQDPSSGMVNLITYGGGDPADRVVESTDPHQVYCYTEDGPNAQHPHALALSRYSGTPEACRIMATKRSPCGTMAPSGDPLDSHGKDPAQYIWKEGASGRTRADLCGIPGEVSTCATGKQQYGVSSATGVSCSQCTPSLTQSIAGSEMGGTGDDAGLWSDYGTLNMQRQCTQMGDGPESYWKACDCTWGEDKCDVGTVHGCHGCFWGKSRYVCTGVGTDVKCEDDEGTIHSGSSSTGKPG